jgi:hypothetical protein
MTGETEERHLFYAILIHLHPLLSDSEKPAPPTPLITGPAVPYFSPPLPDPRNSAEKTKSLSLSYSSRRHADEDADVKECKEKAICLLMAKVEGVLDHMMGVKVKVWEARGWKFAPGPTVAANKAGMGSEEGKGGDAELGMKVVAKGKKDTWFSKH